MKWFVELRFETIEKVLWAIGLIAAAGFLFWLPWDYSKLIIWPIVAVFPALWSMAMLTEHILPRANDPRVESFTVWGVAGFVWAGVTALLVVLA